MKAIELVEVNLDHCNLKLNLKNPVWHGEYKEGSKLSIYEAIDLEWTTEEAKFTLEGSNTFFAVMSNCPDNKGNFLVYGHYGREVPVENVAAHLLSITFIEYAKQRNRDIPPLSTFVPGPSTPQ